MEQYMVIERELAWIKIDLMKNFFFRNVLIALLTLLGIGAIYGGGLLIISPSGDLLGLPISLLEPSPFDSFLLPAIILFIILGILPILVSFALIYKFEIKLFQRLNAFKDMHWSWSFSVYISFALIIWIQLQMVFVNEVFWVYTVYIFWAIIMLFTTLLPQLRNNYRT
jgi:hypothetical protein